MSDVMLFSRTIVGSGDGSVLVEPRANAVRIKTRHGDVYVRNDAVESVARALLEAAAHAKRVRP